MSNSRSVTSSALSPYPKSLTKSNNITVDLKLFHTVRSTVFDAPGPGRIGP